MLVAGEHCLLAEAFRVRLMPIILVSPTTVLPGTRARLPTVHVLAGGETFRGCVDERPSASTFVSSANWLALSAGVIGGGHSDTSTDQQVRCLDCERWMVHGFNVQDQVAGFTCAAEGCDWETTSEHYHYCVECAGGCCDGCVDSFSQEWAAHASSAESEGAAQAVAHPPAALDEAGEAEAADALHSALSAECEGDDHDDDDNDDHDDHDEDDHDDDDHSSAQRRRAFLEAVVGSPQPATTTTADRLVDLLVPRLSAHILSRVRDVRKQDHWCMKWVASNLPNMAALLVTRDLIKLDLSTATTKSCLLRQERDVFDAITATNMHFEGAYLYYDVELLTWIRSGKVAGETVNYHTRHKQHGKASATATSNFYRRYPSIKVPPAQRHSGRRGFFQHLGHFVGLGFDRSDAAVVARICATGDNSLFHWPASVLAHIRRDGETQQQSQLKCVSYLWELVFDLCLSPQDNMSDSPGFEPYLGIYGGEAD